MGENTLRLILHTSLSYGVRTTMKNYQWKSSSILIGTKDTVSVPINPDWVMTLAHKKNNGNLCQRNEPMGVVT